MSIQSEINRIAANVAEAFAALRALGVSLPASYNSDVLAQYIGEIDMVTVDNTLSVSGAAADAKATGDALAGKSPKSHTHSEYAASGHNHDGTYYKKYGLNAINIDSTSGDWSVDISDNAHGTVPETWVNVEQRSGDHFFVQIATKTANSTDGTRLDRRMWTRNKYNGKSWSAWAPMWNGYASARGSASSLSMSAGTVTQLTLDTWVAKDDTGFTFSSGGIKCPYAGNVLISGNVYFDSDSGFRGVYVKKGTAEIISTYGHNVGGTGCATSGSIIVSVAAGDVIYLCARSSVTTTCRPSNGSTVLNVMYL